MTTATAPAVPTLPARTAPATTWKWSADDLRIAAREDESLARAELDAAIARCLAEGVS